MIATSTYKKYAGFWRRLIAWCIDMAVLGVFFAVLSLFAGYSGIVKNSHHPTFTFSHGNIIITSDSIKEEKTANAYLTDSVDFHVKPLIHQYVNYFVIDKGDYSNLQNFIWYLAECIIILLYFSILESSSRQATLGKMALNLVVTDAHGRRITFWRALGRNTGKYVSRLTICIGYIITAFTPRKQALHDLMSGCLVLLYHPEQQLEEQQKEAEHIKLTELKTKAELEALQAKINPHFLYNCLNSIASLAYDDPRRVEQMAIALSKFFRYSINTSGQNYATIKDEIELTKTYLEIEKIRFEDKLSYRFEVSGDQEYLIPRFLLQPLAENAIKHGLSKISGEGQLVIKASVTNDHIEIAVCDNGPDFPKELVSGYGLKSTYEKLSLLFPNAFELHTINGKEKQIKVIIKKLMKHAEKV